MKNRYSGVDITKFFFACLIPLLHIPFENSVVIFILREFLARLGVPFFFAISGMFLSISLNKNGLRALFKFFARNGKLLIIWIIIYLPIFIRIEYDGSIIRFIQLLLFKTPGYLWYLSSLLFASIPFAVIKDRKKLYVICGALYIVGTLWGGGNYIWLSNGCSIYDSIFLTTRNGLFFGLPLMCVGELANKKELSNNAMLLFTMLLYYFEVIVLAYFVKLPSYVDRSMYLCIPALVLVLTNRVIHWNPKIENAEYFRRFSTSIYVTQYGCIFIAKVLFYLINLSEPRNGILIIVYMFTIAVGVLFGIFSFHNRIIKYLM